MKVILIGDIHGRKDWMKAYYSNEFDKFIFLGDYFDSRDNITSTDQIDNFNLIMNLATQDSRIEVLCGNHDFHYFHETGEKYSGYQSIVSFDIMEAVRNHRRKLKACYVDEANGYIYSHAGFTKTWIKDKGTFEDINNKLSFLNSKIFQFNGYDMYGDDVTQGPLWVRPRSLLKDAIDGWKQIVGHTYSESPIQYSDNIMSIDCNNRYYASVENGVVSVIGNS